MTFLEVKKNKISVTGYFLNVKILTAAHLQGHKTNLDVQNKNNDYNKSSISYRL